MLATIFYNVAAAGIAAKDKPLALFELFGWLKYFREQRRQENLSQVELLKKELIMFGSAVLVIAILLGLVIVLIWIHEHNYVTPIPRHSRKTSDLLCGPRVC